MNRAGLEWMFLFLRAEKKMLLSCQQASCIDDHFPQPISPLSHLNRTKEQQKVWIIKEKQRHAVRQGQPKQLPHTQVSLPVCLAEQDIFLWLNSSVRGKVCVWTMNNSGWSWLGSVPSMQGEISHWWPLTDGGLTARRNTDPREYQVSPHYTLHSLFNFQCYHLWLQYSEQL